ncbi:MAG: RNA polymerase sigma-70 factor [Bacteroidetes bacterium HGW-Bacteroidetes-12]|nr:MAG: RNA polymerase sigma-70 factor [Bacteroidetes bacterium HGW-Bacteroidetes-12]
MRLSIISTHKRIQKGDIGEFEKLFRNLYSPLCHYAFRFIKDMDSAEDIVQDLFYNYWKNREKLEITTSLKSYLYQAVRNKCIKTINHQQVKEKYNNVLRLQGQDYDDYSSSNIETEELNQIIESTIDELPDRCKEIFVLSRYEGMKYHEIAQRLSISVKTVEANMGKALKMFRLNLKGYYQISANQ